MLAMLAYLRDSGQFWRGLQSSQVDTKLVFSFK